MIKKTIIAAVQDVISQLTGEKVEIVLSVPIDLSHGDYTTNIAFQLAKTAKKSPFVVAQEIVSKLNAFISSEIEKVEVAQPGFINFWISKEYLLNELQHFIADANGAGTSATLQGVKILVEYAHPNTHKEMHLGHMRTLITGEALSRLLESQGAKVFRANYQGDIGPHVAKAMVGIQELMHKDQISLEQILSRSSKEKAHFLGKGYVEGNKLYQEGKRKNEIDEMNAFLYQKVSGKQIASSFRPEEQEKIWNLYQVTHEWSMSYYAEFYKRFMTTFDRLFLESEMVACGLRIVKDNIGKIFIEDEGAVIFPGEKYGLHRRVFITRAGYPTYEGKEMCNGFKEYESYSFDKKIHVVASEQSGYFQVVLKALELLDADKFRDKQYHLPMGMVNLVGRKMSSRTGEILTVDWLIDQVKEAAKNLFKDRKIDPEEKESTLEAIAIGAIKYSVLKFNTKQDSVFDIQKSVSLEGNSGPYIQYAHARTQSILRNANISNSNDLIFNSPLLGEEEKLLRLISQYSEVLRDAARSYAPNILCEYLFTLAKTFNLFYQKHRILNAENAQKIQLRIGLVEGVATVIKNGLSVLGIVAVEKM